MSQLVQPRLDCVEIKQQRVDRTCYLRSLGWLKRNQFRAKDVRYEWSSDLKTRKAKEKICRPFWWGYESIHSRDGRCSRPYEMENTTPLWWPLTTRPVRKKEKVWLGPKMTHRLCWSNLTSSDLRPNALTLSENRLAKNPRNHIAVEYSLQWTFVDLM